MLTSNNMIFRSLETKAVSGLASLLCAVTLFIGGCLLPGQARAQGTGDLLMTTFPSLDLSGTPLTIGPVTTINQTNLNPGGRSDEFSVLIEGYIFADTTGTYTFETFSDDGVRLFVGGTAVISNWTLHAPTLDRGTIDLVAGTWYPIRVEHYENRGGQVLRLGWLTPGAANFALPPASNLSRTLPVSAAPPPLGTQDARVTHVITQEALRALRAEIAVNERANREARTRHAAAMRCRALREDDAMRASECEDDLVSRGTVPLGFNGTMTATSGTTKFVGDFFGQKTKSDGTARSLYFGDLDVSRFEGGDVSAVFSARYARERMVDDRLFGSFVGLSVTHSDIADVVDGTRTGYGVSAGVYVVDQLTETLTWDGFLTVGAGRNNLDVRDGGDEIEGDYNTRSILMGAALSGSHSFTGFDLRPELSLSVGYTDIGDVSLTGGTSPVAAAGGVTLGRISFAPDMVFALGTGQTRFDTNEFWVTPSVTCEYQETTQSETECGGGLALEWTASAGNGLHDLSIRVSREVLGGNARDSIGIRLESVF